MGSGLFETAEIVPTGQWHSHHRGGERPTISRINIEGNRRVDDDTLLLEVITSTPAPGLFAYRGSRRCRGHCRCLYRGGTPFAANVTPRIIRRSDNRVDLVFEVSEGRVVENERISFVGNRAYSDRRLRRVVETKQAGFLRAIIGRDTFAPERIAFDRQLLIDFYRSRGYVDFQVLDVSTEVSRERDATFVTFNLREGPVL